MTTLHLVNSDPKHVRSLLRLHSRGRKTALIIPCLASEFTDPENLPVFQNILKQLKEQSYLSYIIFGLDAASEEDAFMLRDLIKEARLKQYLIQWNDGPAFGGIYELLNRAGFDISAPGKGKNMFLSFGVAIALGAYSVGLIDADIKSFKRRHLDRLMLPVVALGYDFAKAYYARISEGRVYGRAKRLLLDPLLLALNRKFSETKEEKFLGIIQFLLNFNYQLSGEVAFHIDLLKRMRFATNWGVEIFTLVEAYRKAASVAQVHFTSRPFDHKHQVASARDQTKGLNRMAVDIVTTLMITLVVEEGLEVTDTFFRDLAITYQAIAEEQIKKYSDDASFNNLSYDQDAEEALVRNVFRNSILVAGSILTSPYRISEQFLRYVGSFPDFQPFLEKGLAETILAVESKSQQSIFEMPQTVSWERVASKMPGIYDELRQVIDQEWQHFS